MKLVHVDTAYIISLAQKRDTNKTNLHQFKTANLNSSPN